MSNRLSLLDLTTFLVFGLPMLGILAALFGLFLPPEVVIAWFIPAFAMHYMNWVNVDLPDLPETQVGLMLVVVWVVFPVAALLWPVSVPGAISEYRKGTLRFR